VRARADRNPAVLGRRAPDAARARARGRAGRVPRAARARAVGRGRAGDVVLRCGRALAARAADLPPRGAVAGSAARSPSRTRALRFPPVLVLWLTAVWLLLQPSLAIGQVVLGVVLALALTSLAATLRPLQPRMRRLHLLVPLVWLVAIDIVRSNLAVARIVLGLVRDREVRSGFVKIP